VRRKPLSQYTECFHILISLNQTSVYICSFQLNEFYHDLRQAFLNSKYLTTPKIVFRSSVGISKCQCVFFKTAQVLYFHAVEIIVIAVKPEESRATTLATMTGSRRASVSAGAMDFGRRYWRSSINVSQPARYYRQLIHVVNLYHTRIGRGNASRRVCLSVWLSVMF